MWRNLRLRPKRRSTLLLATGDLLLSIDELHEQIQLNRFLNGEINLNTMKVSSQPACLDMTTANNDAYKNPHTKTTSCRSRAMQLSFLYYRFPVQFQKV